MLNFSQNKLPIGGRNVENNKRLNRQMPTQLNLNAMRTGHNLISQPVKLSPGDFSNVYSSSIKVPRQNFKHPLELMRQSQISSLNRQQYLNEKGPRRELVGMSKDVVIGNTPDYAEPLLSNPSNPDALMLADIEQRLRSLPITAQIKDRIRERVFAQRLTDRAAASEFQQTLGDRDAVTGKAIKDGMLDAIQQVGLLKNVIDPNNLQIPGDTATQKANREAAAGGAAAAPFIQGNTVDTADPPPKMTKQQIQENQEFIDLIYEKVSDETVQKNIKSRKTKKTTARPVAKSYLGDLLADIGEKAGYGRDLDTLWQYVSPMVDNAYTDITGQV